MNQAMASKDPIVVGMVVVGHGRLGAEMVQTLEAVMGHLDALEAVATSPTESVEEIRAHVEALRHVLVDGEIDVRVERRLVDEEPRARPAREHRESDDKRAKNKAKPTAHRSKAS